MTLQDATCSPLPDRSQAPSYLAVVLPRDERVLAERIQVLTPRVMRWDEDIWILDMRACATYWRVRAESLSVGTTELLKRLVADMVGGDRYQAAQGDSPWRAVLTLAHMRARGLTGLVSLSGPFGAGLFRELPWDLFWEQAERAADHLGELPEGRRRLKPELFRRQAAQMQRAVKRLGLKTPWHLNEATPESIKRRFGNVMRELWEWTYGHREKREEACRSQGTPLFRTTGDEGEALFASGFPWIPTRFSERPEVVRHLDFPVVEWAHMEPLLREDFDRLCSREDFHAGERVVSLEWRIVFRDLTHLVIPIRFRHPHSLHLERSHHGTALLQALYAFQSSIAGSPLDRRRLDELIPLEPVVSWKVAVSERLTVPDRWQSLFDRGETHSAEWALLSLENRLSVTLEGYQLRHDWLPEDSYTLCTEDEHEMDPEVLPSLLAVARARPLFLFHRAAPFEHQGGSSAIEFTERTMAKWWSRGGASARRSLQRDYYRLSDSRGRTFWVYRDAADEAGKFHIHGVFG